MGWLGDLVDLVVDDPEVRARLDPWIVRGIFVAAVVLVLWVVLGR